MRFQLSARDEEKAGWTSLVRGMSERSGLSVPEATVSPSAKVQSRVQAVQAERPNGHHVPFGRSPVLSRRGLGRVSWWPPCPFQTKSGLEQAGVGSARCRERSRVPDPEVAGEAAGAPEGGAQRVPEGATLSNRFSVGTKQPSPERGRSQDSRSWRGEGRAWLRAPEDRVPVSLGAVSGRRSGAAPGIPGPCGRTRTPRRQGSRNGPAEPGGPHTCPRQGGQNV